MIQLISINVCIMLFLCYLKFKQKANKKFLDSLTFLIIDREYNGWYSKKGNGRCINKKNISMFEVDKAVYKLKTQLLKEGITREQLLGYLDFLRQNTTKKYSFIGAFIGILGYLGTKTFLKDILPDWSSLSSVSNFLCTLSSNFAQYREVIYIATYLFLLLFYIFILIYTMYKVVNFDYLHKKSQKLFVLNRVSEIWNFSCVKRYVTKEQASNIAENKNYEVIFTKLEPSQTKFEKDFDNAVGKTQFDNYQFVINLIGFDKIEFEAIKEWVLGMLLPMVFSLISTLLDFGSINNSNDSILSLTMFICSLICLFIFFILFASLIDNFHDEKSISKEEIERMRKSHGKNYKWSVQKRTNIKKRAYFSTVVIVAVNIMFRLFINHKICDNYFSNLSSLIMDIPLLLLVLLCIFATVCFGRKMKKK